jgi:heat shock protein HslJ
MSRRIVLDSRIASGLALFLLAASTGAAAQPTTPTASEAAKPLEGSRWRAVELAGKPTPAQDPAHEAYLEFQAGGRVSGSDGCNTLTGTYSLKGDRITFGQMAATQMACLHSSGTEAPFRDALKKAARMTMAGDRLELFDASAARLAVFETGPPPLGTLSGGFAGTSWQLVRFQSMDDTVRTPDDRAKYTLEFGEGGKLTARIDCNRGIGTWNSSGPNQIEFGPLALTRAQCPPGSLHDQMVRQWPFIGSYVMKNGHLFLALKMDGGIYEFEPIGNATPSGKNK